jgi:hypothetical protein
LRFNSIFTVQSGLSHEFTLRASVQASAGISALAVRRRSQAQSSRFQGTSVPFQWRKKGGRWP